MNNYGTLMEAASMKMCDLNLGVRKILTITSIFLDNIPLFILYILRLDESKRFTDTKLIHIVKTYKTI